MRHIFKVVDFFSMSKTSVQEEFKAKPALHMAPSFIHSVSIWDQCAADLQGVQDGLGVILKRKVLSMASCF